MTSTARVSSRGREAVAEQIFQATTFFRHAIKRAPGAQFCSREGTMALFGMLTRCASASVAALLLVGLSASLVAAAYGPRTTIGSLYQQTSDTLSTNGVTETGNCLAVAACYVLFQAAPNKQKLVVHHVSCYWHLTAGNLFRVMLHSRTPQGGLPFRNSVIVPVNTAATEFSASGSVLHMLGTNEIPVILLQADANANFTLGHCTIAGELFPQ
jgi:hypothetical protein